MAICTLIATNASFGQSACEAAKLTASDSSFFDSFGFAVGVSGDNALVGAFWNDDNGTDSGSAYVLSFDGTTWVETQKLLASDGQAGDEFGHGVAIDGDTALIAALQHIHAGSGNGSVYVHRYDGTSWTEQQELLASDGAVGDGFGFSVSISGDVAVIGAIGDDDNGINSGAAYVFRFDGSTWVEEQKLLASDPTTSDGFGVSVAIGGDIAVIGAWGHDGACPGNPVCNSGAAYVFRFDPASSRWFEEQELLASDGAVAERFGVSVSIEGEVVLIGAHHDGDNGPDSGSVYVFRFDRQTSGWVQQQKLLASDGSGSDDFGRSVAIDGNTAVIGASDHDDVGPNMGAAYVFRFDGFRWVEQQKLLPDPGPWTAFFGWSVALSGDTAVIGAHGESTQSGAAYVFAGLSGIDCNGTGRSDGCDILFGQSDDANDNGIPDECECPWDLDGGGTVGINDFLALLGAWGPNPGHPADFDGDGVVGIVDFLELLANWGPCA